MTERFSKRITKQIRIGVEWHRQLKVYAAQRGLTMSRLHDEIYAGFFKQDEIAPALNKPNG